MEHPYVGGLVALTWRQEALELLATLILSGGALGSIQHRGPALRGHARGEIGQLLSLQRKDLVAGLRRL